LNLREISKSIFDTGLDGHPEIINKYPERYMGGIYDFIYFSLGTEIGHTLMIFSIILHYELGNYEFAESLINNTKRYYKKEEKLYESEKVMLAYLKQLLAADEKAALLIFKQLEDELAILSKKETEKRFLNAFDFRRWVAKKLHQEKKVKISNIQNGIKF
jgi:hypothetical protein